MLTNFEELYVRYAPEVYRFALYLSGDRTHADDLVADTFVRAWTARTEPRLPTVKAYLFTIARNLYITQKKAQARLTGADDSLRDPNPPPDVVSADRSELRRVLRGLRQLAEVDRSALLMRALDGLEYAEIASVLGLSVGAAKVRVHRARMKLMKTREG